MARRLSVLMLTLLLVSSCIREDRMHDEILIPPTSITPASPASTATIPTSRQSLQTMGPDPASTPTPVVTSSAQLLTVVTLTPDFWKDLPILPEQISDQVLEIYRRGLSMGNNPNAFSKVGDCHSTNPYFLADYDLLPTVYHLGEYAYLQDTITYFAGSFSRPSLAAKQGLSTAGVLAPLWSDWKVCESNETPLDCEFRLHRPSFALISLGTNEAYDVKQDRSTFEPRLRRIIEHSLDQGVVPILSTKADNDEGDHFINYVTARLAVEYELPLWNFWRAMQPLPHQGLRNSDHLTFAPTKSYTDFSTPEYLTYGMQVRNLTALQVLDIVRRFVTTGETAIVEHATTESTATPRTFQAGETMVSSVDGMTLIYIPAGQFQMGSSAGNEDETPVHAVSLDGYWLDSTEVTQEMFTAFLNASGNQFEGGVSWLNPSEPFVWIDEQDSTWQVRPEMQRQPIVGVSWYGANAYCAWAGRQLPTEAQWEYAAKGINAYRFPWGNDTLDCNHARYAGCGTSPVNVDSLPLGLNEYGVYGLAGNVAEWLNDRYAADYYEESPVLNPTGPSNGYYRVVRGGFWASSYIGLQTSHRDWAGADVRDSGIGFRCALNP